VVAILAAILTVAAWWIPGTRAGAALGWSGVLFWCTALQSSYRRLTRLYLAGVLMYSGGFYWLFSTISDFGGFPFPVAAAIFLLFVCGSAVQLLIFAFTWEHLPHVTVRLGLRTALAWLIAQHFWIRIFPWDFGHTQIALVPLAQLADVTGVTGITFLMMWCVEGVVARRQVLSAARWGALLLLGCALGYGAWIESHLPTLYGAAVKTATVQGNIPIDQKLDQRLFSRNRRRYEELSAQAAVKDALIIWPESAITEWISTEVAHAKRESALPFLNDGSAFLVGALTWKSDEEFYNSSLLVRPDGSLDQPYHKIILMPFGEYTPLASLFPMLKEVNATAAQFTPGRTPAVLSFHLSSGTQVPLAPLICYEDVVPELARMATQRGAELLINQTNDAWFGRSVAPYQHHIIASFRAIENRRFLIRSTNTGLTAVVDPLGRTIAQLIPFTEGTLPMEVHLLSYQSLYSQIPVPLLWFAVAVVATAGSLFNRCFRKRG
jgi:apolipoprotein N-acyltransferase